MDLTDSYKDICSAVLTMFVRDYVAAYIFLKVHTKESLQNKIKRSESALRKATADFGENSKEYKDAKRTLISYKWKYTVYEESEHMLENAQDDYENGLIGMYCHALGYNFDGWDELEQRLINVAEDKTERRKILKKGKEVKKLKYD